MTMTRKTITVTPKMDAWIKSRVESGAYGNDSEYLRDLVRRDEGRERELQELRRQIQAGIDSGVSDKSVQDIWSAGMKRALSENG